MKASIQCHYSWSRQEKRAGGFSSKRQMCLEQKREDGQLTRISVYTVVELNPLFCCRCTALLLHEKTLLVSAPCPGVGVGQPKCPSRSGLRGGALSRGGSRSVSDVDLSATYVAGKRSGELLIQPQRSIHFLSSCFTRTHVDQKESACCGTLITLWPFYRSEPPRSAQVMRFPGAWREDILSIAQATSSSAPAEEGVDTLFPYSD